MKVNGNYTDWDCDPVDQCDDDASVEVINCSRNCSNPEPQHGGTDCLALGNATKTITCIGSLPSPFT